MSRMSRRLVAAVALTALTVSAQAQAPGAGPPPVDETLAPYASATHSVRLPDGRAFHIVCMGTGSPTVILTAGMGDFAALAWSGVQPAMAKTTRVCAWDRPGFGLSDGVARPVTVATNTTDLEAALVAGKIAGPYVVVGHSMGSYESLLFADRHPRDVVGMVLVDPSVPGQQALAASLFPAMANADPEQDPRIRAFRKCAADIRSGAAKAGGPDPDSCFSYPLFWPAVLRQALVAKVGNPLQYETMASFATSFAASSAEVVNPSRNYGEIPLIVLSAPTPPPLPQASEEQRARQRALDEAMGRAHETLAALSSRGINAFVPGSNHGIQRSKPQVVIDAVEAVVREAREAAARP